jgi:hypothetical protein
MKLQLFGMFFDPAVPQRGGTREEVANAADSLDGRRAVLVHSAVPWGEHPRVGDAAEGLKMAVALLPLMALLLSVSVPPSLRMPPTAKPSVLGALALFPLTLLFLGTSTPELVMPPTA